MGRILALVAALALSGPAAGERPAGTLVFASDENRLTAVDVATGRRAVRRIRAVPGCGARLFVTGGHVVFSGVAGGLTTVFSIPLSLDRRPTRLGSAHLFVPSATDGRVWLVGTDCDSPRMVGVREVAVDGRVTLESDRRVPGSWVDAAVPGGLAVYRRRETLAWDAATGAVRRLGLENAFGARGSLVAGCPVRSDCDELAIVDSASGSTVVARPNGRYDLDSGAVISPDGALAAAPAVADRRWSVALVDTTTGTHRLVPGSRTGKVYPELSWSSSGWLFIRAVRRVMAYRPGAARPVMLPTRLPRSVIAFTAG
jgi:hypothetical protein